MKSHTSHAHRRRRERERERRDQHRSRWPYLRALIVACGYLVLFQNPSVSSGMKISFVIITMVLAMAAAHSAARVLRSRPDDDLRAGRLLLLAGALTIVLLVGQLLMIVWTGVSIDAWVRDALNYLLLPAVIAIGLDLGLTGNSRFTFGLSSAVGVAGALSFAGGWLSRRGAEDAVLEQFGLASSYVSFAGICVGFAWYFAHRGRHTEVLLIAILQLALMLLGGGRSTLLYSVALLVFVVLFSSLPFAQRLRRTAVVGLTAVIAYPLLLSASTAFGGGIAAQRLGWFERLLQGGYAVLESDGSAIARTRAYEWTTTLWQESPLIGRGLGHAFPTVTTGIPVAGNFTLDSPIVVLTKFGVLGAGMLVAVLILVFVACYGSRRDRTDDARARRLFTLSVAFLCVFLIPNGFPMENRGFGILVLLVIAVSVSATRASRAQDPAAKRGSSRDVA